MRKYLSEAINEKKPTVSPLYFWSCFALYNDDVEEQFKYIHFEISVLLWRQ
jgi:hypothetical protein